MKELTPEGVLALLGAERHTKHIPTANSQYFLSFLKPKDYLFLLIIRHGLKCPGCGQIYKSNMPGDYHYGRSFEGLFNHPEYFRHQSGVCSKCAEEFREWQGHHITRRCDWHFTGELAVQFLNWILSKESNKL
jgi:hypothetical protein